MLQCDSVDHCGDGSDETNGCEDGLPLYLGDRVIEQKEAIYIGLAVVFTILFAIFFVTVCTRDSFKRIKRRIKRALTKSEEEEIPDDKLIDAELRQALMVNALYDRRVSQPYDTTLNTITGGELAKQLKFELKKIQRQAAENEVDHSDGKPEANNHNHHPKIPYHRSTSHYYDRVSSTSELLQLIDNQNNEVEYMGNENSVRPRQSDCKVLFENIPSVVVSDHEEENSDVVVFHHKESLSPVVPRNSSKGLYQKRDSRFQVSAVVEEKSPSQPTSPSKSIPIKSPFSKPRFRVSKVPEEEVDSSAKGQRSVPTKSRFSVSVVDKNEVNKDGTQSSNRSSRSVGKTSGNATGSQYLQVPSQRRGSVGVSQSSTTGQPLKPKQSRFTVQPVEDPLQSKQNSSIDSTSTSAPSKTLVDTSDNIREMKSETEARPKSSRFTIQKVEEDPKTTPMNPVSILKKIEAKADQGRLYVPRRSRPRIRRASESAACVTFNTEDEEDDCEASAVTVHGFTSVKIWDEKRKRFSHVTHL